MSNERKALTAEEREGMRLRKHCDLDDICDHDAADECSVYDLRRALDSDAERERLLAGKAAEVERLTAEVNTLRTALEEAERALEMGFKFHNYTDTYNTGKGCRERCPACSSMSALATISKGLGK